MVVVVVEKGCTGSLSLDGYIFLFISTKTSGLCTALKEKLTKNLKI